MRPKGTVMSDERRREFERLISGGGVVLFPSDGVYGLGCDPMNAAAIRRIYGLKGRDDGKSAAVMYFSVLAMRELLTDLDQPTREAIAALLPGPLTLVVANPTRRYPLACRDDPERLGIRLIGGPLEGVTVPLFQTSANVSGEPSAAAIEDVPVEILEGLDMVIDGGRLSGSASTVVDLSEWQATGRWRVLREGPVGPERLHEALGPSR